MNRPDAGPRHAATVILLRPGPDGLEAVLQKRGRGSHFMAGAYVFPGGKLDEADSSDLMLQNLPEHALKTCADRLQATPGTQLSPRTAVGLYVAGCRETFEEAGVLLARHSDGRWVDLTDPARAARLAEARRALNEGRGDFGEVLQREGLTLDIFGLHYWAHWITPSAEPRRFDTRFFVGCIPPGQEAISDGHETTDLVWHRPEQALDAHEQRTMFLPPPTQRNLQELAGLSDMAAVAKAANERPISAIMPKLLMEEGKITIVLPWDAAYDGAEGLALPGALPEDPCPHLPSQIALEIPPSK